MGKRMGRPKVEDFWTEAIRLIAENPPATAPTRGGKIGPEGVRAGLQKRIDEMGKRGQALKIPSLRTIGRILREFRPIDEEGRSPYREVYWPESFQRSDLPWEASGAVLELLRLWQPDSPSTRPSVRLARWFWYITQAAPDRSDFERRHYAGWLAAAEATGSDLRRAAEGWLRYAPWRSDEAMAAYEKGLAEGTIPRFELKGAGAEALLELTGGFRFVGGRWFNGETGQSGDIRPEDGPPHNLKEKES